MAKYEFTLDMLNAKIDQVKKDQERIIKAIEDEVELTSIIGKVQTSFGSYDVESVTNYRDSGGYEGIHCHLNFFVGEMDVRFIDLPIEECQQIICLALEVLHQAYGTKI